MFYLKITIADRGGSYKNEITFRDGGEVTSYYLPPLGFCLELPGEQPMYVNHVGAEISEGHLGKRIDVIVSLSKYLYVEMRNELYREFSHMGPDDVTSAVFSK